MTSERLLIGLETFSGAAVPHRRRITERIGRSPLSLIGFRLFSSSLIFASSLTSAMSSGKKNTPSYASVAAQTPSSSANPPPSGGSVSLPPRSKAAEGTKPVWSLQAAPGANDAQVPLGASPAPLLSSARRQADLRLFRACFILTSPGTLTAAVHPLHSRYDSSRRPTASKCDQHNRERTICCRDLKGDDDRNLVDPDIVRDIIIGLADGLTVPFGLTVSGGSVRRGVNR